MQGRVGWSFLFRIVKWICEAADEASDKPSSCIEYNGEAATELVVRIQPCMWYARLYTITRYTVVE